MGESNVQGYSDRFTAALQKAHQLHSGQVRKGINVPYIAHLLAVTALVIEAGGDEDEAIAALLHDGPEDKGGLDTLEDIRREFGDRVADIVGHCTDTFEDRKPEWCTRKREYHRKLRSAPPSALLVSVADKVHNAESTANDFEILGSDVWTRFRTRREGSLWNYASLLEIYREKTGSIPATLVDRLERALDRFFDGEAEKVIARFFGPSSKVSAGSPELRIVSGAVCTGKSRFIREEIISGYVHLDAPRIFLAMCHGQVLDFPGELEEKMGQVGQLVARRALEERRNIVVELIGQDIQALGQMVEQARACGYGIKNDVLDCDVEVALERNRNRGENNISAYYAEEFHLRWLTEASTECSRPRRAERRGMGKQLKLTAPRPSPQTGVRRYAASTVKRLRSCLQRALEIPTEPEEIAALPGTQEIPKSDSDRWNCDEFLVPIAPTQLSRCLKALRVQKERTLLGFVRHAGVGANGYLFTVPDGSPIRATDPNLKSTLEKQDPAIAAFDGRECFRSYFEASLLVRELSEFGAYWHGSSWSPHTILDSDPLSVFREGRLRTQYPFTEDPDSWTWEADSPEDWRLSVDMKDGVGAVVRFITHSPVGQECLIQHVDRYRPGSWEPDSEAKVLAYGPAGIVF